MATREYEESLEELEYLVKKHFNDLLVSMSISSRGCLFLHIWKQPSDNVQSNALCTSTGGYMMEYLPLFHIIGSISSESKLEMKLITYHGKVLDEKLHYTDESEKITFLKQLQNFQLYLCLF